MPEENVELVRRGFMAAMEEEWPTALETLDPDAEGSRTSSSARLATSM